MTVPDSIEPFPLRRALSAFVYLLVDGMLTLVGPYLAMREALFWLEGVTTTARVAAFEIVLIALMVASNRAYHPRWVRSALVDTAVLIGVFQVFPLVVRTQVGDEFGKGMGFLYLVSDWNLLPITVGSFVNVAPIETISVVGVYLCLVASLALRKPWVVAAVLMATWCVVLGRSFAVIREDPGLFILIFFPASVVTMAGIALRRVRLSARAMVWACVFAFMGLVYVGEFPLRDRGSWSTIDGIQQLYPCDDSPPAYPLQFPRDLYVDPKTRQIFLSYGPSSGMVVFDLDTGCLTDHLLVNGMMRRIWGHPDEPYLYGGDDLTGDIYVFSKQPVALLRELDLFAHDGVNDAHDVDVEPRNGRLFVAHLVRAVVSSVDLDELQFRDSLDLSAEGYTQIPAAVTAFVVATEAEGYILTGPATLDFQWRVLRVRLDDLAVLDDALIPGGTTFVAYSAARDSLWVGNATADELLEIDGRTLDVRRTLPGPHFPVTFTEVTPHGTMLSAGPVDPDLVVLCTETGEVVRRLSLGPKLMSVTYDETLDAAFVASGQGIFRIDSHLLGCQM